MQTDMSGSIFSFQAKTVWWTKNRYKLWKEIIFSTVENQNNFTGFTHVYPFFTTPQPRRANTDYPVFSKITLKDHLVVWRVPRVNFWKRSGSSIVNSKPVQYLPPKIFVCGESWRPESWFQEQRPGTKSIQSRSELTEAEESRRK